jgi:hypothetical protein
VKAKQDSFLPDVFENRRAPQNPARQTFADADALGSAQTENLCDLPIQGLPSYVEGAPVQPMSAFRSISAASAMGDLEPCPSR